MTNQGGSTPVSHPVYDIVPIYDMPPVYYHSVPKRPLGKVSALKNFFEGFLTLLKDDNLVRDIQSLISQCGQQDIELLKKVL